MKTPPSTNRLYRQLWIMYCLYWGYSR